MCTTTTAAKSGTWHKSAQELKTLMSHFPSQDGNDVLKASVFINRIPCLALLNLGCSHFSEHKVVLVLVQ